MWSNTILRIVCFKEFWHSCRIVDVVQAYKGVVKEKDALEASIKALTSSKQRDVDKTDENQEAIHDPLNVNKEVFLMDILIKDLY